MARRLGIATALTLDVVWVPEALERVAVLGTCWAAELANVLESAREDESAQGWAPLLPLF